MLRLSSASIALPSTLLASVKANARLPRSVARITTSYVPHHAHPHVFFLPFSLHRAASSPLAASPSTFKFRSGSNELMFSLSRLLERSLRTLYIKRIPCVVCVSLEWEYQLENIAECGSVVRAVIFRLRCTLKESQAIRWGHAILHTAQAEASLEPVKVFLVIHSAEKDLMVSHYLPDIIPFRYSRLSLGVADWADIAALSSRYPTLIYVMNASRQSIDF